MTTMAPAPRAFKIYRDAAIETIHTTPAVNKAAAATPCSSPMPLRPLASSTTTTAARATAAATVSAPARLPPRKRSRQQQQSRSLESLPSPSGGSGPAGGSSTSNTSGWWDVSNKENIDPRTGKQQQQRQQQQQQQQRVSPFSCPSLPVGVSSGCSAAHPRCFGSSAAKKRPLCGGGRCCASAVDNGGGGAGKPVALSSRMPSREPLRELWNRSSCGGDFSFPVYLNALGARTLR